eukprot:1340419-Amphidinium_carterae.1
MARKNNIRWTNESCLCSATFPTKRKQPNRQTVSRVDQSTLNAVLTKTSTVLLPKALLAAIYVVM